MTGVPCTVHTQHVRFHLVLLPIRFQLHCLPYREHFGTRTSQRKPTTLPTDLMSIPPTRVSSRHKIIHVGARRRRHKSLLITRCTRMHSSRNPKQKRSLLMGDRKHTTEIKQQAGTRNVNATGSSNHQYRFQRLGA